MGRPCSPRGIVKGGWVLVQEWGRGQALQLKTVKVLHAVAACRGELVISRLLSAREASVFAATLSDMFSLHRL